MFAGIIFNVTLLGYFKYYDFFVDNINAIFKADFALKHIILPLGISFFTLQQLSYIIDRSWGTAPHYNLIDYVAYVTFFPQLIAGPIVLHSELIPQFNDLSKRKFNVESFTEGMMIFSLGMIKKVLIADLLGLFVNKGIEVSGEFDTLTAWIWALTYAFELYFDFSGYCDLAVGLGKMFNFDLPVNFNSPYKSHSVPEHWQRWHYTLTRFWQTYIYTPITLRGMRKKSKKVKKFYRYFTPMLVFLVSGFWHGASWTFVIWGLFQGLAVVWSQRKKWKLKRSFLTWAGTFLFAIFQSAIFRAEKMPIMIDVLKAMFVPSFSKGIFTELTMVFHTVPENRLWVVMLETYKPQLVNTVGIIFFILVLILCAIILRGKNTMEIVADQKEKGYTTSFVIMLAVVMAWALLSLTQLSTFLYFNF